MAVGLSSLKYQNSYIEKIFEDQTFNEIGIYLVRICVEGIWRYVIVDDYIPIQEQNKMYYPLFLSVEPNCENSKGQNIIEIWPFLVQKAYAKVYSTYESLLNGNIEDFIV